MSKYKKIITQKNKYFIILLTTFLLSLILVLDLSYINKTKNKEQLNKEKQYFFEKFISKRNLEEDNSKNTSKICEKTSDQLQKYYKAGDKGILGIDEEIAKGEKGEHITALTNLFKVLLSKNDDKKKGNYNTEATEEVDDKEDLFKNLIIYGKHILPLVILFGIGILSLPGWIVCCALCCGNCCCCCCKKTSCKVPSFVFSYLFYGICAIVCFYSLGKYNSIFIGLADTECSIIKFVDEVLDGQTKQNAPYWPGIDNITNVLDALSKKVEEMKTDTIGKLNSRKIVLDSNNQIFESFLEEGSSKINSHIYFKNYNLKDYQLDLAKKFGSYDNTNKEASPVYSICDLWTKEYKTSYKNSEIYLEKTKRAFDIILQDGTEISNSLGGSKNSMEEIKDSFNDIKKKLTGKIVKYGDDIDTYGKLAFQLFYTVLILANAGIAVFMLLLCFCSGKLCNCCCCCRCFCKFFIHILWNIMALFMFALFMFGSLLTIFGKMGEDMMSVVSYLISEENLGENSNTILFKDVKKYVNKCFNGNGEILSELGFNLDNMKEFDVIKNAEIQLEDIKDQFQDKKHKFVYKEYLSDLENSVNFKSEKLSLEAVDSSSEPSSIKFIELLDSVNSKAEELNKNEKWNISSTSNELCSSDPVQTDLKIYHPKYCFPTNKQWVNNNLDIADIKNKLDDFSALLELANNENNDIGIRKILNGLSSKYDDFLNSEVDIIGFYLSTIEKLTKIVNNYSGEDEKMFAFMNCKFIKSNIQILLMNLKNGFSNDMYTVGIYHLVAAFCLAFGICFTILLIVIINMDVENNQKMDRLNTRNDDVPEYPINSEGRVFKKYK